MKKQMFFESFLSGLTRLDALVFLTDKKLLAKSFLYDMALWCFTPAGNCLQKVSYSAWHHYASSRQETVCGKFPIRHDTEAIHLGRKLISSCLP